VGFGGGFGEGVVKAGEAGICFSWYSLIAQQQTHVVSVETAPVTFQVPSMSFFCGGIGNTALRFVAGVIGKELFSRLRVRLAVSSQLRSVALSEDV
jgi:hypothetical protein